MRPNRRVHRELYMQKIMTFIESVKIELGKVTWPTRKALLNYTLIVLAFMVFMGFVIGLLDLASGRLISLIAG